MEEENIGIVPNEVLAQETILNPKEAKQYEELYDKVMDSKILIDLALLRENVSKMKDIIEKDITPIAKSILDKVDIDTYKLTDEEKQVEQEIEELMEFLSIAINKLYSYDEEDLDKLYIK